MQRVDKMPYYLYYGRSASALSQAKRTTAATTTTMPSTFDSRRITAAVQRSFPSVVVYHQWLISSLSMMVSHLKNPCLQFEDTVLMVHCRDDDDPIKSAMPQALQLAQQQQQQQAAGVTVMAAKAQVAVQACLDPQCAIPSPRCISTFISRQYVFVTRDGKEMEEKGWQATVARNAKPFVYQKQDIWWP